MTVEFRPISVLSFLSKPICGHCKNFNITTHCRLHGFKHWIDTCSAYSPDKHTKQLAEILVMQKLSDGV